MKKKNVALTLSGLALAGGIAWRYLSRPRDIRWIDHAGELHHALASNFAVVDGVRIHYQEKGADNAETLVLLHGFCSSNYSWKDCLTPLAQAGYRVIAPDLKGFGFSEKPADGRYHVQDQAQLVIGLLDALGVEQATFCGNSYGGATSLTCALMWPSRVKRLVLIDAAYNDEPLSVYPYSVHAALARTWGVGEASIPFLLGSRMLVRNSLQGFFVNQSLVTEERIRAYHRPIRSANCQQAILTAMRQWDLNWIEAELGDITVPTCIIWGEQDRPIPVSLGGRLHLALPHSEFIVLPDCGHMPQEEYPEEVVELIDDFCRRTSPDGRRRKVGAVRRHTVPELDE